jgi:hypothetical protein
MRLRALARVQHVRGGSRGRRATACGDYRNPCHSKSCGALCSRSARFVRSAALRRTRKISIKANRPSSCSMTVARHAIAAPPVLPGAARVPRCISSCRSIIRAVRPRRRSSLPIWPRSTVHKAAGHGLRRRIRRRPRPGSSSPRLGRTGRMVRDPAARASTIHVIELRLKSRRQARPPPGGRSRRHHGASVRKTSLRSGRPGSSRSSSGPRRCD